MHYIVYPYKCSSNPYLIRGDSMEATFGNAVQFALLMTGALVVFMTVMFPIMILVVGCGWNAALRCIPVQALFFGIKVGVYAIIPITIGSVLGWLTPLGA